MTKFINYPSITILRFSLVIVLLLVITIGHYTTAPNFHVIHEIFQRLYYIPIILASFWFGIKGGMITSLSVSLFFAPHLLLQWRGTFTADLGKFLEIVLYNIVGLVTGLLAEAKTNQTQKLEIASFKLQHSFEKLKQQADLLLQAEEHLRRAERLSALGELTAGLAHEIKNPLGGIKGVAEILKDDFPMEHERQEFLAILLKEVDHLNAVVDKFLKFSKPVAPNWEPIHINSIIDQVILLVRKEAENRKISIEKRLMPFEEPCWFDAEQFQQVVLNIVLNSIQAIPASGGKIEVSSKIVANNNSPEMHWLYLDFMDTGIGIPPDHLDKIFNPFFTTKPTGTGLGLAITHKIIQNMKGKIEVKSQPGRGTTFTIMIPLHSHSQEQGGFN